MSGAESAEAGALRLIAGLGNPGRRYSGTRHNVGFRVVEELVARRSLRFDREECSALVAAGEDLLITKPLTYMNRSGYALRCLLERHEVRPSDVLVIYDEVHLPLGRLRLRRGGEPAGHRGLESIVRNLQTTEIPRLRLGVGHAPPVPVLLRLRYRRSVDRRCGPAVRRGGHGAAGRRRRW